MPQVFIIIPAAGLGTRMGAPAGRPRQFAPKQFIELAGEPVLALTLRALARTPSLAGITLAVRPSEQQRLEQLLATVSLPVSVTVVPGGDSRQSSVAAALAALQCPDDAVVLVHDAVRPLVTPEALARVIAAVELHGAAILAIPATDTIKHVERTAHGALITATLPRENIVLAQTPQGARAALLRRAFAEADADGFSGTDEASLLERAGIPVAVAPGDAANLKITRAADLPLAAWYLTQRTGETA